MFISQAMAQDAAGAAASVSGGGEAIMQFLPLILIFVVFYFLLIRPQQKRAKQHREMLSALQRGDRVMTSGGILGTVVKPVNTDDKEVVVEIADNVRVTVLRSTIQDIVDRSGTSGAVEAKSNDN